MDATSFKPLLHKLVDDPAELAPSDARAALAHVLSGAADPAQTGALLTALHIHRGTIDSRPDILAAFVEALMGHARTADVEAAEEYIVDVCGTGGDGHGTFNVSTAAALVAAGAGARVIKHGSSASTSPSGSSDLLRALGCALPASAPSRSALFTAIPFHFAHAPHFHPSLERLLRTSALLGVRTILNDVGPLLNPSRPRGILLGVRAASLGRIFAEALRAGGVERAIVACGDEGLDEISCAGPTRVWELRDGNVAERVVRPQEDFGVPVHALDRVRGGTPAQNARTLERLLKGPQEDEDEAVRDFVLMNAAAVLVTAGRVRDLPDGVRLARQSINTRNAWTVLERFRDEAAVEVRGG
ncbi:glycosyl transferase [Vararia minispora EC-137]|uniref:Glycosyl transferase n=1 Tax=Vararia minispora EC-137 TaxID=1314806 RepID=A0ACB8QXF8_9AGAM|nr:glycosyl transferase [Vararia minispora EC-137]